MSLQNLQPACLYPDNEKTDIWSCHVQDSEGHSLWDLTWYKAHSISANLTPSLLAESGLVPSPLPTVLENDAEQLSAAQDQPVLPTVPEDDAELPSGSREESSLDAVPEHQPEPPSASASSEAGWHCEAEQCCRELSALVQQSGACPDSRTWARAWCATLRIQQVAMYSICCSCCLSRSGAT